MGRVLVVDDEPGWRFILRDVLEQYGHVVDEASDGTYALDLVRRRAPDVIIADVRMPAMSGPELVEQIRSNPATAGIPVIMMSAQLPSGIEADAVFHKGVPASAAAEAVDALLAAPVRTS